MKSVSVRIEALGKTYFMDGLVRLIVTIDIKVIVGHGDQIGLCLSGGPLLASYLIGIFEIRGQRIALKVDHVHPSSHGTLGSFPALSKKIHGHASTGGNR